MAYSPWRPPHAPAAPLPISMPMYWSMHNKHILFLADLFWGIGCCLVYVFPNSSMAWLCIGVVGCSASLFFFFCSVTLDLVGESWGSRDCLYTCVVWISFLFSLFFRVCFSTCNGRAFGYRLTFLYGKRGVVFRSRFRRGCHDSLGSRTHLLPLPHET